jgi:hypothetical protein
MSRVTFPCTSRRGACCPPRARAGVAAIHHDLEQQHVASGAWSTQTDQMAEHQAYDDLGHSACPPQPSLVGVAADVQLWADDEGACLNLAGHPQTGSLADASRHMLGQHTCTTPVQRSMRISPSHKARPTASCPALSVRRTTEVPSWNPPFQQMPKPSPMINIVDPQQLTLRLAVDVYELTRLGSGILLVHPRQHEATGAWQIGGVELGDDAVQAPRQRDGRNLQRVEHRLFLLHVGRQHHPQ